MGCDAAALQAERRTSDQQVAGSSYVLFARKDMLVPQQIKNNNTHISIPP